MKQAILTGLVGVLGVVAACGGKGDHAAVIDGGGASSRGGSKTGGSSSKGGTGGTGTTAGSDNQGGDGQGGAMETAGLSVTITAPTAATDPNQDEIVVTDEVTVVCSISSVDAATKVDGSTVQIRALDAAGKPALGQDNKPLSMTGTPTGVPGEYSAVLPTTKLESGKVSFECSASSTDKSVSGSAAVATFVDHGPTIEVVTPMANSPHALKDVMPMQFTVEPTLLTPNDAGAEVDTVKLYVAGVEIASTAITQGDPSAGSYRTEINFNDQTVFSKLPPEHTSIRIEAVNIRKPKGVTAVNEYPIVVDGKGPQITIQKPLQQDTVHGLTTIEFTADDTGSGLDLNTLEVSLPGMAKPDKYDATRKTTWGPPNGNKFTYTFDSTSAELKNVIAQINVSIQASDLAKNVGTAATLTIYKDDFPPIIDLDPGLGRAEDPLQNLCSAVFDPLGSALNDGATTLVASNRFRVLVYDQANHQSGDQYDFIAGADSSTARLYVQADPSQPFLVDRNRDGICDDVDREDFPYKSIAPVNPGGQLQYSKSDGATPPLLGTCNAKDPVTPPPGLCGDKKSDLFYVVRHRTSTGSEPVVYATGANAEGKFVDPYCTGDNWDLHPLTSKLSGQTVVPISPDGWICLAARVADRRGNRAVSRPLRVCLDDPDVPGVPACANGGTTPPSCTDGCTPPARMPPALYR